jgi:hypothetical protein
MRTTSTISGAPRECEGGNAIPGVRNVKISKRKNLSVIEEVTAARETISLPPNFGWKAEFLFRGGVMLFLLIIFMVFKFGLPSLKGINPTPYCIKDTWHQAMQQANMVVNSIPAIKRGLLILSSLMIDTTFLHGILLWICYGKSGALLWKLVIFYGLRAACQKIFFFRYPPGYIWGYPGFPSLFVPYDITCDFYFSGHTGILVIFLLNNWVRGRKILALFVGAFGIFMVTLLMIYQAHYSIDCPIGALCALYSHLLVNGRERDWDQMLRRHTLDNFKKYFKGIFYVDYTDANRSSVKSNDSDL